MKDRPIGILDSGAGGLSVLKEIKNVLPSESLVFFADNRNCPYGAKSLEQLRKITKKAVRFLIEKECKIIVVACNSITAAFIGELRESYKIPFVGIEPATLVAARTTRNGKIGVLATKTTTESKLFNETKKKVPSNIKIVVEKGDGLVELVEKGQIESTEARKVILQNLSKFKKEGVDQVVLGCTHYPFLMKIMKEEAPEMSFIDPALAVAKQVERCLKKSDLMSKKGQAGFCRIYSSKKTLGLEKLLDTIKFQNTPKIQKVET